MNENEKNNEAISKLITNLESKIDRLDTKISKIIETRFNDTINIKDVIRSEISNLETKIVNDIKSVEKRVGTLEQFRAEINGKIFGSIIGVSVVFTVVTFLINKFL